MLSVSAPITGNYNTYGYVLIHLPMSQVKDAQNGVLNILYITSFLIFVLSSIILLVFIVALDVAAYKKVNETERQDRPL